CAYSSRTRPAPAARGSARGRCRRRVDQVGDTLGLRQVDLAVEECPLGEFAGLRKAGAEVEATAQNLREHRGAAVAVELEHRLAGVRGGRRTIQRPDLAPR